MDTNKIKKIQNMSRDEVEEAIKEYPVAILPLGATEQHGRHLPLGVDVFLASNLAEKVSSKTGALVIPPLPFGYSWVWRNIPGTISLQQHLIEEIIKDVARSVHRYGIKMLVLINGHDANNSSMKYAVRELADELDLPIIYLFYPELDKAIEDNCDSETWHGMIHAGEFETSLMLNVNSNLVSMDKAVKEYPEKPNLYGASTIALGDMSESGVFGNALNASELKGEKLNNFFAHKMINLVNEAYNKYITQKDD